MTHGSSERQTTHRDPYRQPPEHEPFRRPLSWGAFLCFAWVVLGSVTMMLVSHATAFRGRMELFVLVAVATLLGVLGAIYMVLRLRKYSADERPYGLNLAIASLPIGLMLAWFGSLMVHTAAYVPSYMGRRHRKGRKLLAPETERGSAWLGSARSTMSAAIPDAERAALGAEWRENGKKEHASVAAFAQLTLDLMAVGAPPELVAAAQSDALDEIRHAGACFVLARDIDGREESPAPFPDARTRRFLFTGSRRIALTQIAIDALADGVLNEGIAARLLAQLARTCELADMAPVLREMAADESRHAAHSWDIIAWCLESGGATVAGALRGAVDGMPAQVCSALPEPARAGAWECWGAAGVAMEADAFARTRSAARTKLIALLEDHAAGVSRRRRSHAASCDAPSTSATSAGSSEAQASRV